MKSSLLLSILLSFAAFATACGGKEATVDRQGSSSTAQTAGQGDDEAAKTATGGSTAPPSTAPAAAPACTHSGESGSGGGGGPNGEYSCLTGHYYDCATGRRSISCECKGQGGAWTGGTCTCSDTGETFAYDCSIDACSPLPDEVFAKCNLPVPPVEPPGSGAGSTSSSSGG